MRSEMSGGGGQARSPVLETLLQMPIFGAGVYGFKSQLCLQFQLPSDVPVGRQWVMSLPPMQDNCSRSSVLRVSLIQPLAVTGICRSAPVNERYLFFLPLSLK